MTEKIVYGIAGFVLGGIIGGGAFNIIATKELRGRVKELELQNEDLIKENRKLANRGPRGREKGLKNESSTKVNITDPFTDMKSPEKGTSRKPGEDDSQTRINYAKLSKEYKSPEFDQHFATRVGPTDEEDDEDDDLVDDEDEEDQIEGNPYSRANDIPSDEPMSIHPITPEQFKDDLPYRDNETVIYYQEDDILVDSANQVIKDHESVIGKEYMGMISDTGEDFLYVDNDFEDKMYEIIVNHNESFYRDVLGMGWIPND